MAEGEFGVRVDSDMLSILGKKMRAESDGKQLRKELITGIKSAVAPGVSAVQGKLRSIPSSGTGGSPPLGSYLASRVKTQVRLSGRMTGVAVRIGQTPNLRGFRFAAKRLNRASWRHPVFAREGHTESAGRSSAWVEQESPIQGYFDNTLDADKDHYRSAVLKVVEKMASRLARR